MIIPPMMEIKDESTIIGEMVASYQVLNSSYIAWESDDVMPVLETYSYREMLLRNFFNAQVAECFWQTATDSNLDFIAGFFGLTRLVVVEETDIDPAIMESDEALRVRIGLAFEGSGTAGSIQGYRYWALQADGRISDVNVYGMEGAVVVVKLHSPHGVDSAMLNAVTLMLNGETVRPINDIVQVSAAEQIKFDINATLSFDVNVDISTVLANAQTRLNARLGNLKIGQDVTEGFIISALSVDGVLDVSLTSPLSLPIAITRDQVAVANSVVVTNG